MSSFPNLEDLIIQLKEVEKVAKETKKPEHIEEAENLRIKVKNLSFSSPN